MRPDECEIIVVDNSPDGQACALVSRIAAEHPGAIRYISERRPGISHARNAGIALAQGELIAFLDDDGEAHPNWLSGFWSTYQHHQSDVIWGAIVPCFDRDLGGWDHMFATYFTRRMGKTGTKPKKLHATNNSCIRKEAIALKQPFHPLLGLVGGEDIAFFRNLKASGKTFAYCEEAIIFDHILFERTTYRYLLRRNFSQGQVNTYAHTLPGLRNPVLFAHSLITGVLGVFRFSCLAAAQFALGRRQDAALSSLKVARNAGKLLWMRPFRKQQYGIINRSQVSAPLPSARNPNVPSDDDKSRSEVFR
jgi:glycosyltransferase involved in cell wall biosynthesis